MQKRDDFEIKEIPILDRKGNKDVIKICIYENLNDQKYTKKLCVFIKIRNIDINKNVKLRIFKAVQIKIFKEKEELYLSKSIFS